MKLQKKAVDWKAKGKSGLKKKKRIDEIDILKGLGIICVAAGHCGAPFEHFIYMFHMAVFFVASGFFFKAENASSLRRLGRSYLKKVKEIWVPYIFWNTIFILLNNVFIRINVYTDNPALAEYVEEKYAGVNNYMSLAQMLLIIRKGFILIEGSKIAGAFWFLATLFCIQLLYLTIDYILQKITDKYVDLYQLLVSGLLLGYGYYCSIQRLYIYGLAKVASFYCLYYLGHMLSRKTDLFMRMKWFHWLPIGILSFAALYGMSLAGSISFAQVRYGNPLFMLMASLLGWFMLYSMSYFLKYIPAIKKPLLKIGERTLSVVIFHFLAFKLVAAVIAWYYGIPAFCIAAFPHLFGNRGLWWLAYTIVGVCVPVILNYFYHKVTHFCKVSFKNIAGPRQ